MVRTAGTWHWILVLVVFVDERDSSTWNQLQAWVDDRQTNSLVHDVRCLSVVFNEKVLNSSVRRPHRRG
jgi:hypothetical protein